MAKLTLTTVGTLRDNTGLNALNDNFDDIETAIENTLSRDGTSPNTMGASLDMNDYQIINLPDATTDSEPVTLGQFDSALQTLSDGIPEGVSAFILTLLDDTTASAARTTLGIPSNFQPLDSDLTAIAALSTTSYGRAILALADQAALTALLANGTTSLPGIIEIATEAEVAARTDVVRAVTPGYSALPPGFMFGCVLSNNVSDATNDIDITAGKWRDSTDATNLILSSGLTKRLDASWTVGTNQGGLDTGSIANTTYHVYLIKRSDTGVVDVLFSASAASPTLPTNYTYFRRIGSIIRSGGAILPFKQDGDNFRLVTRVNALSTTNPGTSAVSATLTVPIGIVVRAMIHVQFYNVTANNATGLLVTSLDETDSAATSFNTIIGENTTTDVAAGQELSVKTNTSGQIRYRLSVSDAGVSVLMDTIGWTDSRDRLG